MNIKKILEEDNIVPNKGLDQYFLQDERLLDEEIKTANLQKNDIVLEVGCGIGNLTRKIAEKCKVIGIEKDYSFRTTLKGLNNTNIIFGDAIEVLESLRKVGEGNGKNVKKPQFNKIVSNIPYSISQDLILEFMRHKWDIAVLIVQKEFAEKLTGKDKLGMLMKECAEVKMIKQVPGRAFYPATVQSFLVLLKQKKLIDDDFWNFLAEVFKNRNKDVKNVVKNYSLRLANKKIHQLTLEEIKKLYELQKIR